jgi:hypothetical protein
VMFDDAPRSEHIRRVDVNGRIHFAGARYYAGKGLARDSVTVRMVDDEVGIYFCGSLLRSNRRRHSKEREEVIWSHHRQQKNRSVRQASGGTRQRSGGRLARRQVPRATRARLLADAPGHPRAPRGHLGPSWPRPG